MSARDVAEKYIAASMTRDAMTVSSLYAQDGTLQTADHTVVGRQALVSFYTEFLSPMTEVSLSLDRVSGGDQFVAFEWNGESRDVNGLVTRSVGCDFLTLRGGLITLNRVHIHRLSVDA